MKMLKTAVVALGLCAATLSTGLPAAAADSQLKCDGYDRIHERVIALRSEYIRFVKSLTPTPEHASWLPDMRKYAAVLDVSVSELEGYGGKNRDEFACVVFGTVLNATGEYADAISAKAKAGK